MPTKRGPILKKLRYYISQMPPENLAPHKKLNASTKAAVGAGKGVAEGLSETIAEVQESLMQAFIRQKGRRGELADFFRLPK